MRHADCVTGVRNAALDGEGATSRELRRAIELRAAVAAGRPPGIAEPIPESLTAYIDKVIYHAYRVTDEDVNALKQAGYSEQAIFEVTVCAAVGAGMGRLERGLAALKEAQHETGSGGTRA